MRKRTTILEYCIAPKTFTELKELTKMSDAGLSKALQELINEGYLGKTKDGKYVATEKGLESKYKEKFVDNMWFKYYGLSDEKIKMISELLKDEKEFYLIVSKSNETLDELTIMILLHQLDLRNESQKTSKID